VGVGSLAWLVHALERTGKSTRFAAFRSSATSRAYSSSLIHDLCSEQPKSIKRTSCCGGADAEELAELATLCGGVLVEAS